MALTISTPVITPPDATTPTGSAAFDVTGVSGNASYNIYLLPDLTMVRPTAYPAVPFSPNILGLAPGTYRVTVDYPSPTPTQSASVDFTIPEYVAPPTVDAAPPALAAAHLPMIAVIRAAPSGTPLAPAVVVVAVEVKRGASWVGVGKLREVCDAVLGTAQFDLSEFVKTQFAETPPDESGSPDPALSIPYRARYGLAPDFVGAPGTEAGTLSGLALNAAQVINPGAAPLPFALGPPVPYASVPAGYARFESLVNSDTSGVVNTDTVPVVSADWPCAVRQFVWLHPSGGWAWGFFSGRHEHGDETGDGVTVRRSGGVERYVSRGDVRERLNVYSDLLDFASYELLRSVRTSVQVYERLRSGLYVPVVVEPGSYPGYKETDKTFKVDFTVRYPVQVRQTQ